MGETLPPPLPQLRASKSSGSGNPWDMSASFAGMQALMVLYKTQRRNTLRQEWYSFAHNRRNVLVCFFGLPGIVVALTALGCIGQGKALSVTVIACLVAFVATVAVWSIFLLLLLASTLLTRYPRASSSLPGAAVLVADGIYSHQIGKTSSLPWTRVRRVEFYSGDVFFRIGWQKSPDILVPRESFSDAASARRFFDATLVLWRSGGTVWPEDPAVMAEFAPCLPAQAEKGTHS